MVVLVIFMVVIHYRKSRFVKGFCMFWPASYCAAHYTMRAGFLPYFPIDDESDKSQPMEVRAQAQRGTIISLAVAPPTWDMGEGSFFGAGFCQPASRRTANIGKFFAPIWPV